MNDADENMRIITRKTLKQFWVIYPQAEHPLKAWYKIASKAFWNSPNDIKADYRSVSFLDNNRVCFNIGGNKFRLIVKINYNTGIIYIRFIGTHEDYNKIDANRI